MEKQGFQDANLKSEFRSKGPELLVDLASHCTQILLEMTELDKEKAQQIGREIAERMATHWGGQNIYFPMGLSYILSKRDRQIYAEFNGNNHSELARKYGISLQWVYKLIKTVHKEEIAARQQDMFT